MNIGDITNGITNDIGSVQSASTVGEKGPFFIFEEIHTSRAGQLQIAAMLMRLHEKYGLKKVGLEGAIQSDQPLDASWFHQAGGERAKVERENVGVRILAEGEISSAEFMALLLPDVKVYGLESAALYGQTLGMQTDPELKYLLAIAERRLTAEDVIKINRLVKQGKEAEAVNYIMNIDPWVRDQFTALKASPSTSGEEDIDRLREIQRKAREVGADIDIQTENDMENLLHFYETTSQRTSFMADRILALLGTAPGEPTAVIIGAAHTDKLTKLLSERKAAFVVIQPTAINSYRGSMSSEAFDRKSTGMWARNSPGTLGRVLNRLRKPPPIINRTAGHSYISMILASLLIAEAGRAGGQVPESIWPQISNLPALRIDQGSFVHDGYDVICRAWLQQDISTEKEVWARLGTLSVEQGEETLEQKLLHASEDLMRSGITSSTGLTDDEGPYDFKRKGFIISRISKEALAAYGLTKEEVIGIGRLSL